MGLHLWYRPAVPRASDVSHGLVRLPFVDGLAKGANPVRVEGNDTYKGCATGAAERF